MISWLNFEELLIHNPIELINFSKSNIQVALSKKQYIDFFSNKAVYMGLYYDEEMDFCVMFYADPLQSSKNGEMYAEGYIDVDMKIYRVKVLSNVSISRFNSNFNLLEGTKDFSGWWGNADGWANDGTYKGLTVKKKTWQWWGIFKPITMQRDGVYTFSAYIKGSGDNANIRRFVELWDINGNQKWLDVNDVFMGNNFDWKRDSFTLNLKKGDTLQPRYEIAGSGTLWTAGHKWEEGSVATPYMPAESETTSADLPKWNVTKTGMLVSPQAKQITMVQAGALMKCEINNNISGWTDGTTQLEYSGQDFIIDGYGMRGLHNG
jgi:hypothetical protein|nr:MAG TPA: Minor structural protein 4 [Caudoviricetes sp.]